ncbi:competence protein CoiA family protein [Anaeromyxobacter sp. PSR-1]|uniref:competence protein CoiA family protein n=1 Tax=Anaeromyxobacter sp. PSR-1 TaxID=1300915 RepID=UPI000750DE5C|nr:competence protein CoiA family protein [Anaeromyxobacter sp. PSR-1]
MPRRRPAPARMRPGHPAAAAGKVRAPVRAGARGDVLLAWALDRDGRKVNAGRLDPADRRRLAPFTCLGCGEPLVPHLGRVRARHFAHAPGSACPLTAPETALHLDAKERLLALCADAFERRRTVTVLARCPSCRRLAPRDLAAEGDAAAAEGAVGPLRADVLVLRAGSPALAIEVLVTHAVEAEKEAALAAAGVPAVEIDAREEWERAEPDGAVAIVPVRSLGFPACPACAAGARADADRALGGEAAEIAELEAYRARGLLGPALRTPVPAATPGTAPAPAEEPDAPFSEAERAELRARFSCPDCGGAAIAFGARIARHPCPGRPSRPIAWRGYDGARIELTWWKRPAGPAPRR